MARNSNLERLRAEVLARHTAANRKVSRLRREKGVEVEGTSHDIRRDISKVKRYNTAQLNSYLKQLNSFTDRSTQFVAGKQGAPIPIQKWRAYEKVERKYNELVRSHDSQFGDTFVPTSGMTIAQRAAMMTPDKVVAHGTATAKPYSVLSRKPNRIKDAEALEKLRKDVEKKLSPDYLDKRIKQSRREMRDMLKVIGAPDLQAQADKLTDYQFNILWNYGGFAEAISASYAIVTSKNEKGEARWHASMFEDRGRDAKQLLDWGGSIPREAPRNSGNIKREAQKRKTQNRRKYK